MSTPSVSRVSRSLNTLKTRRNAEWSGAWSSKEAGSGGNSKSDGSGRAWAEAAALQPAPTTQIAVKKDVARENRLWPMRELLGDSLLAMHESAPALKEYETSLLAARNRYRSFYGAAKAAEQLGEGEMAKSYYQKLLPTIWT